MGGILIRHTFIPVPSPCLVLAKSLEQKTQRSHCLLWVSISVWDWDQRIQEMGLKCSKSWLLLISLLQRGGNPNKEHILIQPGDWGKLSGPFSVLYSFGARQPAAPLTEGADSFGSTANQIWATPGAKCPATRFRLYCSQGWLHTYFGNAAGPNEEVLVQREGLQEQGEGVVSFLAIAGAFRQQYFVIP